MASGESAAGFGGQANGGGTDAAYALAQQHYDINTNAHGYLGGTLGRGSRTVPNPSSFFSSPPSMARHLSSGQFSNSAPIIGGGNEEQAEEESS
jgi:hypothetical protein